MFKEYDVMRNGKFDQTIVYSRDRELAVSLKFQNV